LQQMPEKGVWAGLWALPLLDSDEAIADLVGADLLLSLESQPRHKHVLTHLDWWLNPRRVLLDEAAAKAVSARLLATAPSGRWVAEADLRQYGLPAPLRKLLG